MSMYMTTPIFVLISDQKMAINGILVRQTFGATDLYYGVHTQPDFGSNMGGIPPGLHLFPLVYKVKQWPKKNTFE